MASLNSSQKGLADDPVKYFAAQENRDLGVVKSIRKPKVRLIVAPFPQHREHGKEFFFSSRGRGNLS